jgi:hypothetical protein
MCVLRAAAFCGLRLASVAIAQALMNCLLVSTPFDRTGTLEAQKFSGR